MRLVIEIGATSCWLHLLDIQADHSQIGELTEDSIVGSVSQTVQMPSCWLTGFLAMF